MRLDRVRLRPVFCLNLFGVPASAGLGHGGNKFGNFRLLPVMVGRDSVEPQYVPGGRLLDGGISTVKPPIGRFSFQFRGKSKTACRHRIPGVLTIHDY